jgi:rhodanese-related sulfurtransferase
MKFRAIHIGLILVVVGYIGYLLYDLAVNSEHRISAEDAKQQKYDLILDVRTSIERQRLGHHPDSVDVASADLEKIMPSRYPNKSMKILVYCNTGHRARLATDKLHSLGYKNSVYITEGYKSLL